MGKTRRVSTEAFIARAADRLDLPSELLFVIYEAFLDEMIDIVTHGDPLVLTNVGRFYLQRHLGQPNCLGRGRPVEDYLVLKFSATRSMNRQLDDLSKKASYVDETRIEALRSRARQALDPMTNPACDSGDEVLSS